MSRPLVHRGKYTDSCSWETPILRQLTHCRQPCRTAGKLVALYEHASVGTVAIITDQGQGSGFVYDKNGHIVTNFHVIEDAKNVEVRFNSGFMAYGTVIGTDLDSDLAIFKVDVPEGELFPLHSAIRTH